MGAIENVDGGDKVKAALMALKYDAGLSIDWSSEEQAILERGLAKYTAETLPNCYAKIAKELQRKTVRDVALRCKWMNKKESAKKRKEVHNLSKKNKDKKDRITDLTSVPSFPVPPLLGDDDDGITYKAIGGWAGPLLQNTHQLLQKICLNLSNLNVQENYQLFHQALSNLYMLMNGNNMTGKMAQMPPLPVRIDEQLVNSILASAYVPMQI